MSNTYPTKFLLALAVLTVTLLLQAAPALASCTYHTYFVGSRTVMCTVCCYGSSCTTTCF